MDSTNKNCPDAALWGYLPDTILLHVFNYLSPSELLNAGLTCRNWCRISYDEILWKKLFYRHFKLPMNTPIAPGKSSWYSEFKRLEYYTPRVCSEVLKNHKNEVLHVSFSHNGTMFATSSKDGFIVVWNSSHPASVKHYYDMKVFCWRYTQFSQFNQSDTLLLVTGVNYGVPNSTSGEIAVLSLEDRFRILCRVGNKPYDIFGTWYSDRHFLSGDMFWLAPFVSTTRLWINKPPSKESASLSIPILNQILRFYNTNASSVRVLMVADSVMDNAFPETVNSDPQSSVPIYNQEYTIQVGRPFGADNYMSFDDSDIEDEDLSGLPEKLLIFTTGSKTYTPHQIGFKRLKNIKTPLLHRNSKFKQLMAKMKRRILRASRSLDDQSYEHYNAETQKYDNVDYTLDMHGHIIGMSLSPDHRYLYINTRSWPAGYVITDPLDPPPIAQEIDIHVIDLKTFKEVRPVLRSHKAYTPNNECFFIFLDVSDEYVASGAEDKHGYIWDRHYGICFAKLPHENVVNSVAFNPINPEMLVSTSDDYSIKIWRSKHLLDNMLKEEPERKCKRKKSNTEMC